VDHSTGFTLAQQRPISRDPLLVKMIIDLSSSPRICEIPNKKKGVSFNFITVLFKIFKQINATGKMGSSFVNL